jgi:hypothetical protein
MQLFAVAALATAVAACGRGAAGLGVVPSTAETASPSLAQNSLDPNPSRSDSAPLSTTAPSASPTSSPIGTPSPTDQANDPATVLAADGIGPYEVGTPLSRLQSKDLVANLEPSFHCDDEWESARATGPYADQLTVTFHLGRLIGVHTASTKLVTPSGARVGMRLTELQTIYGSRGKLITGASGNQALSVRVPDTDLGIVFYLNEANTRVRSMSAGRVDPLVIAAESGEGC